MCCNTSVDHGARGWGRLHGCPCGCLGVEYPRENAGIGRQGIAHLQMQLDRLAVDVAAMKTCIAGIKRDDPSDDQ